MPLSASVATKAVVEGAAAALFLLALAMSLAVPAHSAAEYSVGFLPAMTNPGKFGAEGKRYAGAIVAALRDLNAEATLGAAGDAGFALRFAFQDSKLDQFVSIKAMTDMYINGTIAFLGPENSCVNEARIAAAWNLPMIGYSCGDQVLSNKRQYPTFARTSPSTSKVSKSIIALMTHWKWKSFALVKQNKSIWHEASRSLGSLASFKDIAVNGNYTFPERYGTAPEHASSLSKIIEQSKESTRIYVFLGEQDALVDFVKELVWRTSHELYAVITVRNDPFDYSSPTSLYSYVCRWLEAADIAANETLQERMRATVNDLAEAFRNVITLIPKGPQGAKYKEFEVRTIQYLHDPPFKVVKPPASANLLVPQIAAYLYDAVIVYGRALREVLSSREKPNNGSAIMARIYSRSYTSIQGFDVHIDENGDAEANYSAVALTPTRSGTEKWTVNITGYFRYDRNNTTVPGFNPINAVNWSGGSVPLSEPPCGFKGELCPPEPDRALAIAMGTAGGVIVVVVVMLFILRHYYDQKKIDRLLWKIDKASVQIFDVRAESERSGKITVPQWHIIDDDASQRNSQTITQFYHTHVGICNGALVSVKIFDKKSLEINKVTKKHLHTIKELHHENVNKFIGACVEPNQIWIITQYCSRGSLEDVLMNSKQLFVDDSMLQVSLISDLVKGMVFIHDSPIGMHGSLRSSCCMIDARWVLQIGGFGLQHHLSHSASRSNSYSNDSDDHSRDTTSIEEGYFRDMLWQAPELIRSSSAICSQKCDVYSFGIILHEICGLQGPWGDLLNNYTCKEIALRVQFPAPDLWRPSTKNFDCDESLKKCMEECWTENPDIRPDFKTVQYRKLKNIFQSLGSSIMDNLLQRLENYANNLESLVEDRTTQLKLEKKRTEKLLLRMLPRSVADNLKKGIPVQPMYYRCVTIYFSDIVGFTQICATSTPYEVVKMLNDLYTRFDEIIGNYDVYKVETIGDAYMVVSGVPKENGNNHAGEVASMALHLLSAIRDLRIHHKPNERLKLRIGIHSGPVAAGVVGVKMPRYTILGDSVNTASRMESTGEPLKIHCSEATKELLDGLGGYYLDERGPIDVKGKGIMCTYWLMREDDANETKRRRLRLPESQHDDSACESLQGSVEEGLHLATGAAAADLFADGARGMRHVESSGRISNSSRRRLRSSDDDSGVLSCSAPARELRNMLRRGVNSSTGRVTSPGTAERQTDCSVQSGNAHDFSETMPMLDRPASSNVSHK